MTNQAPQTPSRRKDILAVIIVAFIGLMLGLNLYFFFADDPVGVRSGVEAPLFELPVFGEEGQMMALENYRGQVVVMDFWAEWCKPCEEQMPALEQVATDPEMASDVVVFSINTDQETERRGEAVANFLERLELTLPTLMDDGNVRRLYDVRVIPTLVIVDRQGAIHHISYGLHDEARLRSLLGEVL